MSMRQNIRDIYMTFINDEILLRLLYYPPENLVNGTHDPLDESLPNVLDMDIEKKWEIIDDRIVMTPKVDDLDKDPKCRLLFYAGRRKSSGNYLVAKQEIICDVLCHFDFEKDQRSMWISDRINELLIHERITGIGKVDYGDGHPINAPNDYVGYRQVYEFGSVKK